MKRHDASWKFKRKMKIEVGHLISGQLLTLLSPDGIFYS